MCSLQLREHHDFVARRRVRTVARNVRRSAAWREGGAHATAISACVGPIEETDRMTLERQGTGAR